MKTSSSDNLPELSEREKEVAALLLQGKSNKQIAQALGVATRTVEFHAGHIYKKLGVSSRSEAIVALNQAHLRESTGADLRSPTGDLRSSTVENEAVLTENGENLKPDVRRNRMSKFGILLIVIVSVALIGAAIITAVSLTAGLLLWSTNTRIVTSAGTPRAIEATVEVIAAPTYTPYQPTPAPLKATYTPIQPAPTVYDPFATSVITTLSPLLSSDGRWTYEGVSFAQDAVLASSASGSVIAAKTAVSDGPFWEVYPQHVRITLDGYPLAGTEQHPLISVYPVEEYRQSSQNAAETLARLQDLLARRPADDARLPYLPLINAGLTFHAGVQYLDFKNGSGVRYLGELAQYPAPVNNKDLFYTFQGLTKDGRHFISMVVPIQHPSLLASADDQTQDQFEAMLKRYDQYRSETATALEAQPPSTFTPALDHLDALVQSIMIDR